MLNLVVLVLTLLVIYLLIKYHKRSTSTPPGPAGYPLVGNLLQIGARPHLSYTRWAKMYGGIYRIKIGSTNMFILTSTSLVKEAFNTGLELSGRMEIKSIRDIFDDAAITHGVNGADGESWNILRRFTLQQLHNMGYAGKRIEEYILDEVRHMLGEIEESNGKPVKDIMETFSLPVVSSLWRVITGERLTRGDAEFQKMLGMVRRAIDAMVGKGSILFLLPWIRHVAPESSGYNNFRQIMGELRDFFVGVVSRHEKNLDNSPPSNMVQAFLQQIHNTSDKDSHFYGDLGKRHLVATMFDIIEGGYFALTTAISWSLLYLAVFTEVQDKVREETNNIVAKGEQCRLSDRSRMPYTQATIAEIHRFSSVTAMGVPHRAVESKNVGKYMIPKGSLIIHNIYGIHMDEEIWGDPTTFRPTRFLNPTTNEYIMNENLMPFSFGKRQCFGKSFANDTIFLFITNILKQYTVSTVGDVTLEPEVAFALYPKPFALKFEKLI
ncbi:farnesoate epoxidase isoform X2 [Folsomia candida]|uniref:farnesoate epoxidase isoform X2 n=1 Tax=Folsomia candida TaxID=158441 RepID=UPI001604E63E|nr:farnesoate epoxidase isoform X2 [Folsomia candida]